MGQLTDVRAKMIANDIEFARADAMERVKAQLALADAAIKSLILANGGAMVALFTFIGSMTAKPGAMSFGAGNIWYAFASFVGGLVMALLCYICAFVSQDRFYNQSMREVWRHQDGLDVGVVTQPSPTERRLNRAGMTAYAFGLLFALASTVAFAAGSGFALGGVLIGQ